MGICKSTHANQSPMTQRQDGHARGTVRRDRDGEVLVWWVPVGTDLWYLRAVHVSVSSGGDERAGIEDAAEYEQGAVGPGRGRR